MRMRVLLPVMLAVLCCATAMAELQQVEVGGSLRIRGNYFNMDSLGDYSFVEQRTRLNVKANFTEDVTAFIEFDYYDMWGEDFRSVYLTGADFRAGQNDVALYQGYIDVKNMWGTPLSLRVGRQEFKLGNQFFIGAGDTSAYFTGVSWDGLLLSYVHDVFALHLCTAKTYEAYSDFLEDDADIFGAYFTYFGMEDITMDAYWLYVRDDVALMGDRVDLHTLGMRGGGVVGAFDFELEAAYQLGEIDGVKNPWFRIFNREADVDYDEFGVNAELGYTFDIAWQPRLFARFAYLGGGDPDRSGWSNDMTMPFNRLGSNIKYSELLENDPTSNLKNSLSNVLFYSLGVQANPTECLTLKLAGAYLEVDEEAPATGVWPFRKRADDTLGWEVGLNADYNYSEDLVFRVGYSHFFGDEALEGSAILGNGLFPWNGDEDDDYDYVFIETELCF